MRSLTVQTTLALMTGLLAVLLAQAAFIGYYNYNLMMGTAKDKINTIMAAQADNVAVALWNLDFELMQAQVAGLMEEKTIRGVQITEQTSKNRKPIISAGESFTPDAGQQLISAPIVYINRETESRREIGQLDLVVDYSPVKAQIQQLILILVSITSLVFGAVGFMVYSVVKSAVSPVNRLSTLMSHNDALHRPLHELDEISAQTREVNQLITAFKTLQGQFFEYKNQLIKAKEEADDSRALAERANRAKTEFLANMSHELRTPLNSVIGLTQMLKESETSEDRLQMFNTVELSSQNLLSIVNDVLDISKIESSNFTFESIPFNPHGCVQNVVRTLRFLAQKRNLTLQADISIDPSLNVLGDPKYFTQILTNLLANAIKYTEKGSVTVTALQEDAGDGRKLLTVHIKDTGIGIPADRIDSIFDKFVQADASTTRKYGGSGLGLAITRNLAEMMGGKITVESTVGAGSTFSAVLPFEVTALAPVELENTAPAVKESDGALPAAEARVLLAEDHELNQFYMKKLLPSIGLRNFEIVANGQLALEAVQAGKADIILMDCHMPVMNGYDASQAIRKLEQEKGGHIPIIALTANALQGERENCLNHGMDDYMTKPADRHKLKQILSRWIAFEAPAPESAPQKDTGPVILDLSCVKDFSQGDADTEKELLAMFVTQSADLISRLSQCVDAPGKDWHDAAHTLKGCSATAGALALRDLCAQAQAMTAESTAAQRQNMLDQIVGVYEATIAELQQNNFA